MQGDPVLPDTRTPEDDGEYEPPAIESVLTADELTREVQYAGAPVTKLADFAF